MCTEKPAAYAIIDSEGWFVLFKGDVNSQYELELSPVPDPEDLIDQAAVEARFNRIMENAARHKDLLHFPVRITPLFPRHIMTVEEFEKRCCGAHKKGVANGC